MSDSLAHGHGLDERSPYCNVWKAVFGEIDRCIEANGAEAVLSWVNSLEHREQRTNVA